jgi:hypothetical protein
MPVQNLELEYKETVRELFRRALRACPDQAFAQFLDFMRRFNRYSLFNSVLIYTQRPEAAALAALERWRELGREVNDGARPIVVLQPFAPVQLLYDIADTGGDDVPDDALAALHNPGKLPESGWERTLAGAVDLSVIVDEAPDGACLAGDAAQLRSHRDAIEASGTGRNCRWHVRVNGHLELAAKFATLAHQLAHVYCGHHGGHPKNTWRDRRHVSLSMREVEAETASWLVCARSGILNRTADYLNEFAAEHSLMELDIPAIANAAELIEARNTQFVATARVAAPPRKVRGQMSMFGDTPAVPDPAAPH